MSALEQVLAGTAPAHLVVVQHALGASPWPLVCEMLARSSERLAPILAITLLHDPSILGSIKAQILDLSGAVPGFTDVDVEGAILQAAASVKPGTQILLDAADILLEDQPGAFRILRALLTIVAKPPSSSSTVGRLILPLPASSPFTADILSASLSPSLAVLTPFPPRVVEATASAYMLPPTDERFFPLLESASARGAVDVSVLRDSASPNEERLVVQLLLRKAAGGAKGIVRGIEGFQRGGAGEGLQRRGARGGETWSAVPLTSVVDVRPATAAAKTTTHADLNLPFNLTLTEQQREARGAVPLPYAHEGEGADLSMGMDWSDDEEDDEI